MAAAILFRCHDWICALPSADVLRLLQADDVPPPDSQGRLQLGAQRFVTSNLGPLLGAAPVAGGWLLVGADAQLGRPPMALQIGAHLSVASLDAPLSLDPRCFAGRAAARKAAFAVPEPITVRGARFGILLDVAHLWLPAELAAARQSAAAAD